MGEEKDEDFGKDGFVCHRCFKPIGIDVVIIQSKEDGVVMTRLYDKPCYLKVEMEKSGQLDH